MSWAKLHDASGIDRYVNLEHCVRVDLGAVASDWFIVVDYAGSTSGSLRLDGTWATQAEAETVASRLVASEGGLINTGDLDG